MENIELPRGLTAAENDLLLAMGLTDLTAIDWSAVNLEKILKIIAYILQVLNEQTARSVSVVTWIKLAQLILKVVGVLPKPLFASEPGRTDHAACCHETLRHLTAALQSCTQHLESCCNHG